MIEQQPPPPPIVHPTYYYIALGFVIVTFLYVLLSSYTRGRSDHARYIALLTEVYRVSMTIQSEGRATRHLLIKQDARRRKRLAREGKLRLDLGPEEAEAQIALGRVLDAAAEAEASKPGGM